MTNRLKGICSFLLRLDPEISNLKLQKLLYFIQASSLYYLNQPAFADRIEAWLYGPVVPEAYNKYRFHYEDLINYEEIKDKDLCKLIHVIYNNLGKRSSFDLVNLTHSYSAYKDAWNREVGGIIRINDIINCHNDIAKKKNGFIF